jgi:hypothetical protein
MVDGVPPGRGRGGGWEANITKSTPGPLERATPAGVGQYRHAGENRHPCARERARSER